MKKEQRYIFRSKDKQLYIEFAGIQKVDNIDEKKINTILNNIFENNYIEFSIDKIVYYIRTIFKDYNEKYIFIKINDIIKNENINVTINNRKIENYEIEKDVEFKNIGVAKFKMSHKEDLDWSISNLNGINLLTYSCETKSSVLKLIFKNLRYIELINNNIFPKNLSRKEKALVEIYKLFFNDYPDFSNKQTRYNVYAMMSIINKYDIHLSDEYGFNINEEGYIFSSNIQNVINNLLPYGQIVSYEEELNINNEDKEIIMIIGEMIKKLCNEELDKNKMLQDISIINKYLLDLLSEEEIIIIMKERCSEGLVRKIISHLKKVDELITNNIKNQNEEMNTKIYFKSNTLVGPKYNKYRI